MVKNIRKVSILAWPATRYKDKNPYGWLLYRVIQANGKFKIIEFSPKRILFSCYKILHVHWPEKDLSEKNTVIALLKTIKTVSLLLIAKIRGSKIVWTVHNSLPHNINHPKLTHIFYTILLWLIDGYICLSHSSYLQAIETHPNLINISNYTHPFGHGHYKEIYPNNITRDEAKKKLGVRHGVFTFLFFGNISPYKNVVHLANTFSLLPGADIILLIAGNPTNCILQSELEIIARKEPRIHLSLGFVPVEEVQVYFNASDLVVLPFDNLQNSGTALLSLSFNVPILVPESGSMVDLKKIVGEKNVITYKNNLTVDILKKAIGRVVNNHNSTSNNSLDGINWDTIGLETEEFYKNILGILDN